MYFNIRTNTFLTDADLQVMGIRSDSPNLLTSNMLVRLNESAIPTPGDYERVQEILPVSATTEDGTQTYSRAYEVVDMFPNDIEETDFVTGITTTLSVQEQKDRYLTNTIKANAKSRVTDIRINQEQQGLIATNGIHIDTSPSGISRLVTTSSWSDANPTLPVVFPTKTAPVTISRAEFVTSVNEVSTYVQANAAAEGSLHNTINAATDMASIRSIEANVYATFPSVSNVVAPSPAPGTVWTLSASNTTSAIRSVGWGNAVFIALGANGTILTSPDANSWARQNSNTTNLLRASCWTGTAHIVVGDNGTLLTSPDATSWTARSSGTSNMIRGVASSGTTHVAVGSSGTVVTSSDLDTWTQHSFRTPFSLAGVCWSGSIFVAIGESGTVVTSPDGITWTVGSSDTTNYLYGITWTGSQFVVVGTSGTVITSPDGIVWTAQDSQISSLLFDVTWTTSMLVAVGISGTIVTSADGVTWVAQTSGTSANLQGVGWSGTRLVAGGNSGTIVTS